MDLIEREGLGSLSYEEIEEALNSKPLITNPNPPGQIPSSFNMSDFWAILSISSLQPEEDTLVLGKVASLVQVGKSIGEYLEIPSTGEVVGFVDLLESFGLSPETTSAIRVAIQETQDDPNHPYFTLGESIAEQEGFSEKIRTSDIQEAFQERQVNAAA